MRMLVSFALACLCVSWTAEAKADGIQLPCDTDMSASFGTGIFTGSTFKGAIGLIRFARIQPAFLNLEGTLFDNCEEESPAPDVPKSARLSAQRFTRHWFGRMNLYAGLFPNTTRLEIDHQPAIVKDEDGNVQYQADASGQLKLDQDGEPMPETRDGLTKADLKSGGWGWQAGVRLSIYDSKHLHADLSFNFARSFGSDRGEANTVVAHANNRDIDVTPIFQDLAEARYFWSTGNVGLTVGVPFRPSWLFHSRITPYGSFGYTWLTAGIKLRLKPELANILAAFDVDSETFAAPRTVEKASWSSVVGVRWDPNDRVHLNVTTTYVESGRTSAYMLTGNGEIRFDFPWKW